MPIDTRRAPEIGWDVRTLVLRGVASPFFDLDILLRSFHQSLLDRRPAGVSLTACVQISGAESCWSEYSSDCGSSIRTLGSRKDHKLRGPEVVKLPSRAVCVSGPYFRDAGGC
jgi:hypothetical protein